MYSEKLFVRVGLIRLMPRAGFWVLGFQGCRVSNFWVKLRQWQLL